MFILTYVSLLFTIKEAVQGEKYKKKMRFKKHFSIIKILAGLIFRFLCFSLKHISLPFPGGRAFCVWNRFSSPFRVYIFKRALFTALSMHHVFCGDSIHTALYLCSHSFCIGNPWSGLASLVSIGFHSPVFSLFVVALIF